jgi:hypothetical protein
MSIVPVRYRSLRVLRIYVSYRKVWGFKSLLVHSTESVEELEPAEVVLANGLGVSAIPGEHERRGVAGSARDPVLSLPECQGVTNVALRS